MRPLPRVHAYTDAAILADPELGIRAAAGFGEYVAGLTDDQLARFAEPEGGA